MKVFAYIFMSVSLITAIAFGYFDKPVQMGIMIAFFLFFGILSIIEKIEYFKLSKDGLEAKINKLDSDVNTINETLNLFSEMILTAFAYTGN